MAIETNFRYNQVRDDANVARLALVGTDLLGPLRAFIGDNHTRTWSGPGFNMIWRPHDGSGDNNQEFFLELDVTKETLSFTDITGGGGIANRGLLQPDIALGGLAYQQEVSDVTVIPNKALHFEPGVWVNVPATDNPKEVATVARMGSVPHGTTIHAQGTAIDSPTGLPIFSAVNILPFPIGAPDDGAHTEHHDEGVAPLATSFPARTPLSHLVGVTDAHFTNLIKILSDVTDGQKILSTKVFIITTEVTQASTTQATTTGAPDVGGGTDNIAFLVGTAGGPNASPARMTAIFWVEEIEGAEGKTFLQLQYVQRVVLNFAGRSWPHVSLATMVVINETQ